MQALGVAIAMLVGAAPRSVKLGFDNAQGCVYTLSCKGQMPGSHHAILRIKTESG
jgi:hypothetical protein